ncbi:MAG: IS4 family transposase [Candidatus Edwardsbacteria bacterium]
MSHYSTLFSHILWQIPRHHFENLSRQYKADRYVKKLSTWNQFTALLYAQISGLESLREIENAFIVHNIRTYHLGLPSKICRNTLSHANKKRDWRIYQEMFYKILARCKDLTPKHKFKFPNPLYTIDATTISLCLSLFPWSKIKHKKGAIKMHFQFDHSGDIPCFMVVTGGDKNDLNIAKKHFELSRDSIYCFDRGYMDARWFARISHAQAYFVTRLRGRLSYRVVGQHRSFNGPTKKILSDEVIELTGKGKEVYKRWLRLIKYYDSEHDKIFYFLTNHMNLPAKTIADIYKSRWQIESFFRWIKQNLKIKTFFGTSENAVLTQVWSAMCYYLLLAYIKYQSRYSHSLYYLHMLIKAALMQPISILDTLNLNKKRLIKIRDDDLQPFLPFS